MTIQVGESVPNIDVRIMQDGVPAVVPMSDLIGTGRVVLFAVPGAFTPGCSKQHLPSYIDQAETLAGKGVDRILCLGVNDVFVMDAWGNTHGVGEKITMVADADGSFTKAVGMDVEAAALGGLRSKRYALVAEDGVVTAFLPEEDGFSVLASTAQCVVDVL